MSRFIYFVLKLLVLNIVVQYLSAFSINSEVRTVSHSRHVRTAILRPLISRKVSLQAASDASLSEKQSNLPPWLPAFGTACLGGLMFGLDIGSSSSVLRILGKGDTVFGSLDALQLGQIASSSLFGAIVSSAAIIVLGDSKIGRKLELQVASVLFILGTLLQSSASDFNVELAGRALYGLGIGTAMHVAPLFIGETSPDDKRGKLISFKEAAIVLGIVAGYAFGAGYAPDENWRGIFYSALPFEAMMLAGSLVVPESPRWLALRGRKDEAVEAIQSLQGLDITTALSKVDQMIEMSREAMATPDKASANAIDKFQELFSSKYNRRALVIGIGLVLFQQLSGQPSVLYFANRIFEQAGLGFQAAVVVGLFKLLMTTVSANLVENPSFGRRSLLLWGNSAITVSLLLLSYLYGSQGDMTSGDLSSQIGIIASMFVFVGAYQIGFGPITWLVLSEIFPLRVRSAAVSLGTLANFSSNLLVTLLFEEERQRLGESQLFLEFSGIALLSVLFTFLYVFETRGLSLEEIELKLREETDKA